MKQFKRAQVIMLPTDKEKGSLAKTPKNLLYQVNNHNKGISDHIDQHLYIISDDEIKEDDWCLNISKNIIYQKDKLPMDIMWKKIITTTDTSLVYEKNLGYLTINPNTLDEYRVLQTETIKLPQPSQQFIEKYIESYNKNEVITNVLVEYEVYMQRQSNSGTTRYILSKDNKSYDKVNFDRVPTLLGTKVNSKDNTITIKKLKDSWNRDEVVKLLEEYRQFTWSHGSSIQDLNNWIKKNL